MKNKTKLLAPRSRLVEAVQWTDPKKPPRGVAVTAEEYDDENHVFDVIVGEYRTEFRWRKCGIGDWFVYSYANSYYPEIITHFDSEEEMEKHYVVIK